MTTGAIPDFTPDELRRYSRHFVLPEFGLEGQRRLKAASVLVVGVGGLGSPLALYLAAAGIGRMGLVDFDAVDASNLQRQILHGTSDVGRPKLESAMKRLRDLNPDVRLEPYEARLTSENALEILARYDVIADGTDNFPTRYLVNDACVLLGKPNAHASIFRFEGQASVFDAARGPCYRCLYPDPPPPGMVPSCAEGGVLGVLPGILGTVQAIETVKLATGIGDPLVGRLLLFDALGMRFRELTLRKDPECPLCGERPTIRELVDYEAFCGLGAEPPPAASPGELPLEIEARTRGPARARRRGRAARRARAVRAPDRARSTARASCRSRRSNRAPASWTARARSCASATTACAASPPRAGCARTASRARVRSTAASTRGPPTWTAACRATERRRGLTEQGRAALLRHMNRTSLIRAGVLLALAFALAGTTGCATNPVTGRSELSLVSADQELKIGSEGHTAILSEYGLYDDPRAQAYVDSIGQALARNSHLPNLQWHFTVLDDPVVNAFATPGGYVYITRGILSHLNSEAQLAGVLGHEIGHVTARHGARQMTQRQIAGLGLGLASVFSETFRKYSDAAQQGLSLLLLKYGRDDETQADELGVQYSTKAGWDAREIPATYAMLKRVGERAGQRLPAFLSTHPDPGDREVRTRALAVQAVAGRTDLRVNGRSYLQRLDGMVYGRDPRQGYFDGGRYYHPGLALEMQFPGGWQTQDTHTALVAVAPEQRAQMQMTLGEVMGRPPVEYVTQLVNAGKALGMDGRSETLAGWPAWVGRLEVADAAGQRRRLATAFVQRGGEPMIQVLGVTAAQGDPLENTIFDSMRSMRRLTDSNRLNPTPSRVKLARVGVQGALSEVLPRFGAQGIDAEETAILNNLALDEEVRPGETVKIVTPTKLR